MRRFRKIVSYCLIFTLLFNSTLTSLSNTAWASNPSEDVNSNRSLHNILAPINEEAPDPAAVAKLQQVITEEWEEKYTPKGFSIVRMIWTVLATIIGFIALNAWEPINAKTLFPKLGIPSLGFGTESAFYEATAAIHGIMALGIFAYSYTIFKFGLKLFSPVKTVALKAKQSCSHCFKKGKNKPFDLEKADSKQPQKEVKSLQPTLNIFRKWTIPKVLCAIPLEIINIGSAVTYSMIVTSYFRKIEMRFPGFANLSTPFLVTSIAADKLMTGHTKIRKMLEWVEDKCRRKKTSSSRAQFKKKINQTLEFVKSLDLENDEGRKKVLKLINHIFPENEFYSVFKEELEETTDTEEDKDTESSSSDEEGPTVKNLEEKENPNTKTVPILHLQDENVEVDDSTIPKHGSSEQFPTTKDSLIYKDRPSRQVQNIKPSSQGENIHESSTAAVEQSNENLSPKNDLESNQNYGDQHQTSPINFEKVYKLINQDGLLSTAILKSKIAKCCFCCSQVMSFLKADYVSFTISFLAIWGLSTTMTQGLETMFDSPSLATIFGSNASLWIALIESQDITKALERIIVSLLPHKVFLHFLSKKISREDNDRNTSQPANKKDEKPLHTVKSLLKFLTNVIVYKGVFLTLAAWAYTFFELADYLNEAGESYTNSYTKINTQNSGLKYTGFITLYLFENLSNMHLQDRAYENFLRRIKQFTLCPNGASSYKKKLISIFRERLIGIFEVMLKTVDDLTDEGLEVLEKLIPLSTDDLQSNPAPAAQNSYSNNDDSSKEDDPEQPLMQKVN